MSDSNPKNDAARYDSVDAGNTVDPISPDADALRDDELDDVSGGLRTLKSVDKVAGTERAMSADDVADAAAKKSL